MNNREMIVGICACLTVCFVFSCLTNCERESTKAIMDSGKFKTNDTHSNFGARFWEPITNQVDGIVRPQ